MIARGRMLLRTGLTLAAGIVIGAAFSGGGPGPRLVHARDSDQAAAQLLALRSWLQEGETTVSAGPIAIEKSAAEIQISRDALYYLNYTQGRLYATLPSERRTPNGTQILGEFAERDLVADFGLKPGAEAHFLLTTATFGGLSDGWAPLFVFETVSGQVAVYRVSERKTAGSSAPTFQLLERKSDPRLGRAGREG